MFVLSTLSPDLTTAEVLRAKFAASGQLRPIDPTLEIAALSAEVIGTTEDALEAVALVLLALRADGSVGVGLANDVRSGVELARQGAHDRKRSVRHVPLRVLGAVPSQNVDAAQAVLRLVGRIVVNRSQAEWRVLDELTPGVRGSQGPIAQALGISSQAVSKAIARAGWVEEWDGRRAAALLLNAARQAVRDWS